MYIYKACASVEWRAKGANRLYVPYMFAKDLDRLCAKEVWRVCESETACVCVRAEEATESK